MSSPLRLPCGLTGAQAVKILGLSAHQVYYPGSQDFPQIHRFLDRQVLPVRSEDFRDSFRGGLKLAFGGICSDKIEGKNVNITDGRFDKFINETIEGLADTLSCGVFGATYWAWMPAAARAFVQKARVPIMGVMPAQGLADLYAVRHLFEGPDPVPKMHSLAIVGETYRDTLYAQFMASCADGMVNIGGRAGAKNEVDAFLNSRKPVFLAPVSLGPDENWLFQQTRDGITIPKTTHALIKFLQKDFTPHNLPVGGSGLSFREHLNVYEFRTRHARDITIGMVSTSGAVTDTHRLGRIVDPLLQGIQKKKWKDEFGAGEHRTLLLGGLTAMGGIYRGYEAALRAQLGVAGIMTWKGVDYTLMRGVEEMIIVGDEWGQESKDFVDLIDIMLVLGPPKNKQGWKEAIQAMEKGIPTIILWDPILAPDSPPIPEGAKNVWVFRSDRFEDGTNAINTAIEEVLKKRRMV